jgi:hypothetical protein
MAIVALTSRDEIIERVAQGEMLADIAHSLGIAPPNISKHLSQDPEYRQAREMGAERRLDAAVKAVQEVADIGIDNGKIVGLSQPVSNLARVRLDQLKAVQWFAEREFPHRWGIKQQVDVVVAPTINFVMAQPQDVVPTLVPDSTNRVSD